MANGSVEWNGNNIFFNYSRHFDDIVNNNGEGCKSVHTLEDYLLFLKGKGFRFEDDAIGFIYFGKHFTNASDKLVNVAIEITLKAQKRFDGSFYLSLLELFTDNNISHRREAFRLVKEKGLLTS